MGDKVKVSILEVNGVEETEGPCERALTADIVELTPALDGHEDVDAYLRSLTITDPFLNALFDLCTPLFDCDAVGNVELLEECG